MREIHYVLHIQVTVLRDERKLHNFEINTAFN